jgi:hypothetical protein
MSSLDQIIDYTQLFQDIELSTALQQLRNNPGQLQQFLQSQQDNIYKGVIKQKEDSFQKVYGDLERASNSQESTLMYNIRNQQLGSAQNEMMNSVKKNADSMTYDRDLAERKYEMNEWSINNKRDTLFVYSMLFIVLCGITLFILLWRIGIIGIGLCGGLIAILLIIFTFTVVDRSQYTDVLRNNRYWNRRTFKGNYGKIPIPNICPGLEKDITEDANKVDVDITNTTKNIVNRMSNGINSMSSDINNMTQNIKTDVDNNL